MYRWESASLRAGLPRESDLAGRLGLSRNSLREAVRALSLIHVLDVRQGDGTYVTTLDPSLLEELVANDTEFHRRIAAGSRNGVLCSLIEGLSGPTQRAPVWRGLAQQDAVARTLDEHRMICDAIAGRNRRSRAWATVHVAGVEPWLRQALAE